MTMFEKLCRFLVILRILVQCTVADTDVKMFPQTDNKEHIRSYTLKKTTRELIFQFKKSDAHNTYATRWYNQNHGNYTTIESRWSRSGCFINQCTSILYEIDSNSIYCIEVSLDQNTNTDNHSNDISHFSESYCIMTLADESNADNNQPASISSLFRNSEKKKQSSLDLSAGSNLNVNLATASAGLLISGSTVDTSSNCMTGFSVKAAGDINADGYDDFIVGAPFCNAGTGVAYVMYGGYSLFNMDLTSLGGSGFSVTGNAQNSFLGYSGSGAGDVNGDGFSDVIVSAPSFTCYPYGYNPTVYSTAGNNSDDIVKIACSSYTVTDDNYAECSFDLCEGAPVVVGSCLSENEGNCTGTQGLSLYDAYGYQVANGIENYCGVCSQLTYAPPTGSGCQTYTVRESCEDYQGICTGTVRVGSCVPPTSYVLYGGVGDATDDRFSNQVYDDSYPLGTMADIDLAAGLTPAQGFAIVGDVTVVSGAGDFNGDGLADLLVSYSNYSGVVYVIFGGTENSDVQLSEIANGNNTRGFAIFGVSDSQLGVSVSSAGDVNGDGFDDIILGASHLSKQRGAAYLLFGSTATSSYGNIHLSAGLSSSVGVVLSGYAINDQTGSSVAGAGDVNNDGYADLLIGAQNANSKAGLAYLVFGSATMSSTNLGTMSSKKGFVIYGGNTNDLIGGAVSSAGDVNGDNYDDILLSSPYMVRNSGVSYVIYGRSADQSTNVHLNALTTALGYMVTNAKNPGFMTGFSVSTAGDVNRDGFSDILIGAPQQTILPEGADQRGVAYLVFGQADASLSTILLEELNKVFVVTGSDTQVSSLGGYSVSVAGDVNSDGLTDYLVGAPTTAKNSGSAYVIYGQASGFTGLSLNTIAADPSAGAQFMGCTDCYIGFDMSSAGDFNGDNVTDILMGAPFTVPNVAYVVFGGSDLSRVTLSGLSNGTGLVIQANQTFYDFLGNSVSNAGDVNGDGHDDIVIAALQAVPSDYYFDPSTPIFGPGKVYVLYGAAPGSDSSSSSSSSDGTLSLATLGASQGFCVSGWLKGDFFGWSVSGAGKFDDAEYTSVVIGAPGTNSKAGAVYILYGGANLSDFSIQDMTAGQGIVIYGAAAGDLLGYSVSQIGDFNGDGHPDIIIGAPGYFQNTFADNKGKVYVIYGGKGSGDIDLSVGLPAADGIVIVGGSAGDQCGISVGGAGDYNYDGFPDVLIGCPYANGNAGYAYVIFGGHSSDLSDLDLSALDASRGFQISGGHSYDSVGFSVAGSSDAKGNGVLLVGAPTSNSFLGTTYMLANSKSLPTTDTSHPTINPSSSPSSEPSADPSSRPTSRPSTAPSPHPTQAPTPPPFWVSNGPIIVGVLGPAVLGFIPIFFSKQICFAALERWGSKKEPTEMSERSKRSSFKAFIYTSCKRLYIVDYAAMVRGRDLKKDMDERATLLGASADKSGGDGAENTGAAGDIEMSCMAGDHNGGEDSGRIEEQRDQPSERGSQRGSEGGGSREGRDSGVTRLQSEEQSAVDHYATHPLADTVESSTVVENPMRQQPLGHTSNDRIVNALFSIRYDNPVLNTKQGHLRLLSAATLPVTSSNNKLSFDWSARAGLQRTKSATATTATTISPVPLPSPPTDTAHSALSALLQVRLAIEYLPVIAASYEILLQPAMSHIMAQLVPLNISALSTGNPSNDTELSAILLAQHNHWMLLQLSPLLSQGMTIAVNTVDRVVSDHTILTSLHLVCGHVASLLLPERRLRISALWLSTAGSVLFGLRGLAVRQLSRAKTQFLTTIAQQRPQHSPEHDDCIMETCTLGLNINFTILLEWIKLSVATVAVYIIPSVMHIVLVHTLQLPSFGTAATHQFGSANLAWRAYISVIECVDTAISAVLRNSVNADTVVYKLLIVLRILMTLLVVWLLTRKAIRNSRL